MKLSKYLLGVSGSWLYVTIYIKVQVSNERSMHATVAVPVTPHRIS